MKTLLAALVLLATVTLASAQWTQSVMVAWDANTEPDIDHYTVYWGYDLTAALNALVVQATTAKVTGLLPQHLYYFYVTASNTSLESDPSNTITFPVKSQPPTGFTVR